MALQEDGSVVVHWTPGRHLQRNAVPYAVCLPQGTVGFIDRVIKARTTRDLPSRRNPLWDRPPDNVAVVPHGMDPQAILESDPLWLSGSFWQKIFEGEVQATNLKLLAWAQGHFGHCARCAEHRKLESSEGTGRF